MTTVDVPAGAILRSVEDLAPTIAARAAEIEAARRLPADLLQTLADAGCFRMLLPVSHGGHELDLPRALQVCEALARADASVAWTVVIGAAAWIDLAGLSRPAFDALFATGPDVRFGGAINPSGVAAREGGGYRINGRWAFVSGCEHCDWFFVNCIDMESGTPELRIAVLSRAEVEIEDTWHVAGMCGTGSHHITVHDVLVSEERTFPLLSDERCLDVPIVRLPAPSQFGLAVASVAVGIAQGALDDILALAGDKVPLLASSSLATNPLFQHQLGVADTELRAARALLRADVERLWTVALSGAPLTLELRAHVRATGAWATARATAIVDAAYHAGGSNSLYLDSSLQRRLRDMHALTQHFLVRADTLTTAGSILAGQELTTPVF